MRSHDELVEGVDGLASSIAGQQRDLLRFIVACDRRGVWVDDGCRDMAQWVSGRLGVTYTVAASWVKTAHKLEELPHLSAALSEGTVSLDKVVQLARFVTADDEERMLLWARKVGVNAIRRKADLANRPPRDETAEVDSSRCFWYGYFDDGKRFGIDGDMPASYGPVIGSVLDRLVQEVPVMPTDALRCLSEEERAGATIDQRRADALLLLAMGAGAAGGPGDASSAPPRPVMVIHAGVESLGSDAHGRELEGGPVIHPEVARRLVCDGRLQSVVYDGERRVIGIGRASRVVPDWLHRQLRHRDRCCTFPGCGAAAYLQAHHIVHWEHGGATDLDNLTLVCHFHHKLVHEHMWAVELGPDGTIWRRPNGRAYLPGEDKGRASGERGPPSARAI